MPGDELLQYFTSLINQNQKKVWLSFRPEVQVLSKIVSDSLYFHQLDCAALLILNSIFCTEYESERALASLAFPPDGFLICPSASNRDIGRGASSYFKQLSNVTASSALST